MNFFTIMQGLGIPLGFAAGGAAAPPRPFQDPARGTEFFVKGSIIVPTVQEGFANIRIEMGHGLVVNPGFGDTLAQRQAISDRELSALLAGLMAKAEVVRAGHLFTTTPAPLEPPNRRRT